MSPEYEEFDVEMGRALRVDISHLTQVPSYLKVPIHQIGDCVRCRKSRRCRGVARPPCEVPGMI